MRISSSTYILFAAFITEGLVTLVAFILWGLLDVELLWDVQGHHFVYGLGWTIPLLFMNEGLYRYAQNHRESIIYRFGRDVITPLCTSVTPSTAFILGLLSGFGEELLFRGILLPIFTSIVGLVSSLILTSTLFAWVHFIGQVRNYGGLIPVYTIVGLYFGAIYLLHASVIPAMVCHATYNFVVIIITKNRERAQSQRLR